MTNLAYNKQLKVFARQLRNEGTKAEARLWKFVLRAGGLDGYHFKRQRPVLGYIADFLCEELKLIIEVDGISHDHEELQKKDRQKQKALQQAGYTLLRFTDSEVLKSIGMVNEQVSTWIEKRIR